MKVICLNGWGGRLHAALLPWLAGAEPDVLCLQEVVHSPATTKPWLTYRDGDHVLAQRANLFAEVAAALPDHCATFCPAALGSLWDGAVEVPSYWGLASFVHRSLVVVGQAQGFVHKEFSAHGYGEHPRSRVGHALRLHDPARGLTVSLAQMHGLRDLRGKGNSPERAVQAARFLALSDQVSRPGDLRILCGDFNVEPGSATLALMQARGFTELVTGGGFAGTRTSHYTKPGRFADYLLVDQPQAVRRFTVVRDPEVSDHCPLLLDL